MPTNQSIGISRFICYFGLIALFTISLLLARQKPSVAAPPAQKPDKQTKANDEAKVTNQWAVRLTTTADPNVIAAKHGFINLGQVGSLTHVYLFQQPAAHIKGIWGDPERLRSANNVIDLTQQFARQQHKRQPPTDPLYPNQ